MEADVSSDWNFYTPREVGPLPGAAAQAAESLPASDLLAAENPIGVTPEQCERHRLTYLRALLAEVQGRGR